MESFLPFLGLLALLIFVHEMGHFLAARFFGVHVDIFSIGFGPKIFSFQDKKGTKWQFCWLLFGGYTKMRGEFYSGHKPKNEEKRLDAFVNKKLSQKAWIVAAGPLANFLFAILVFAAIYMYQGYPVSEPLIVGLDTGSPAEQSGFKKGDFILSLNQNPIDNFYVVKRFIYEHPGDQVAFLIRRGEEEKTLIGPIASRSIKNSDGEQLVVGYFGMIGGGITYDRVGLIPALLRASYFVGSFSIDILDSIARFIRGRGKTEEVGSVIKIAHLSGNFFEKGWIPFIAFGAILSINLGMLNLLPIPVLDGGHLLFYAIEAIRGRPISAWWLQSFFKVGAIFLLSLFILALLNDLSF